MTWLVTGAAGFVGSAVSRRLLADGERVVGVDNLNDYYDPKLKRARLSLLAEDPNFHFEFLDLADLAGLTDVVSKHRCEQVVHLAAQAGVRYAQEHPLAYSHSNLVAFMHVLEVCRHHDVAHLTYASSSSVYGLQARLPFVTDDLAGHPASLYAATKRANELMAHAYSHNYGIPASGLRFFTVYGPWGRPDMAYYAFAEAILDGRPITVNGDGTVLRDFTYVDDIVEGVVRCARRPAEPDPLWSPKDPNASTSSAPWRLYNIGCGSMATVNDLIAKLEARIGRPAVRIQAPPAPGDMLATEADTLALRERTDFTPRVSLDEGLDRFVAWIVARREGRA